MIAGLVRACPTARHLILAQSKYRSPANGLQFLVNWFDHARFDRIEL